MKHSYIVLIAVALLVAATALAIAPTLGQKTAVQGTQGNPQVSIPPVRPLPVQESSEASSPAVQMPTAQASPTMMITGKPTMKATPMAGGKGTTGATTGAVSDGYVATVIESGLITTTISPGGVINGYAIIRNNGNDVINDALVHIDVMQQRAGAHSIKVTSHDQPLSNLNIAPGDQKRVEFSMNVPGSIAAGSYNVQATVEANGQQINTFTKTVTVS
jgi:hypothetical protein